MLNYGKSNLVTVTPTFGDEKFETAARLSFKQQEDGSVRLVPHLIQKEANLKEEFKGYKFRAEDSRNLRERVTWDVSPIWWTRVQERLSPHT